MINETSRNSLLFLRYFPPAPSRTADPPTPVDVQTVFHLSGWIAVALCTAGIKSLDKTSLDFHETIFG